MILPTSSASFEWRQTAAGPVLVCPALERHAEHFFTTSAWTLGLTRPAGHDEGAWGEVAGIARVSPDHLIRVRQVHGNAVVTAGLRGDLPPADIVVSHDPTLAIAVQSADCVPLLIVDRRTGAAAAAHAGWRGMAARVPETAIRALEQRYGSRPEDLIVAAGPSIGACCYEVGQDVRDAFAAAGFTAAALARWFSETPASWPENPSFLRRSDDRRPDGRRSIVARNDRWFFDGWASTREQLLSAGVPSGSVFSAALCTASHSGALCSYRRDGSPAGRMAAVIRPATPRP